MSDLPEVPDYSGFSQSIKIPFTRWSPDHNPAIEVTIKNKTTGTIKKVENVGLDTGSAVFALSENFVPDFPTDEKECGNLTTGRVEYAAGRSWEGKWFPVSITFDDGKGNSMSSEVKVLVTRENANTHYLGIGFGIFNVKEKNQNPCNNAVLAVNQHNGKSINGQDFRRGYIMHKRSIEIGLTAENTKDFKYTKLNSILETDTAPKWYRNRLKFAIRVDGGGGDIEPWHRGVGLIDTGVWKMEINIPNYKGPEEPSSGTKIDIRFPDENTSLPGYSFKWSGEREDGTPESIAISSTNKEEAFVNTAQFLYDKLVTVLDVEKGWFGIREWNEQDKEEDE